MAPLELVAVVPAQPSLIGSAEKANGQAGSVKWSIVINGLPVWLARIRVLVAASSAHIASSTTL